MKPQLRKLICVGDREVGKTSLLTVISKGKFPHEYHHVVQESCAVAIEVRGEAITLELGESSKNGEVHLYYLPLVYSEVHAILFCFSIEWGESLANIPKSWAAQVEEFAPGILRFLIGCKKDLRTDKNTLQDPAIRGQEPVTYEQGEAMARTIGATYLECSSLTGEGVRELLLEVTERMDVKKWNRPRKPNILDSHRVPIEVKEESIELYLWDTVAQGEFEDHFRPLSYGRVHAVLICFSIDYPDSIDNVTEKLGPEVKHYASDIPRFLVGYKKDLRHNSDTLRTLSNHDQTPVTYAQGEEMAHSIGAVYQSAQL
ncbi:hypothetical protein M408DRAFT_30854 [Serendipita vermifera MAFF 305830]|uniref:Uncharacterized protein n=1 Tax=Serendipita vermifera MAFF 305830 TaxID=933852 RepID=A0A0C2WQF0_SERVB|nr:hypothetical protein M408DRAFT_30854 [Serendipita vermifera MAFF 305830]